MSRTVPLSATVSIDTLDYPSSCKSQEQDLLILILEQYRLKHGHELGVHEYLGAFNCVAYSMLNRA